MNERDIDKHSVNCYFCGELVDERECEDADEYNDHDGGSICPKCIQGNAIGNGLSERLKKTTK